VSDAIAITLLFGAITSALGINRQMETYRCYHGWRFLTALVLTVVFMVWFAIAAVWMFWHR
jgi:hypothetical protein